MTIETTEDTLHDEITALWTEASKESTETAEVVKTDDKVSSLESEKTDVKQTESAPEAEKPKADDHVSDPVKEEVTKEENTDPLLSQDRAPSGWAPKARERWNEIPEDLRSEILRREEASAKGVRQLQEEVAPMRGFVNTLAPFIQEAASNAMDPAQYIGSVMVTERVLRTGNIDQKFEALLSIADTYKIPLREIINKSAGEEILKAPVQQYQLPREIQQELEESRRWRQQQSSQASSNEISQFAKNNEFFEDVREDMAALLEAGRATDLKSAYEAAIWANPQTREVLLARKGGEDKKKDLTEAQKRAAAAGSKSNESLNTKSAPKTDSNTSTEDDIRASIAALSGRD